ncbi:hypothetical protein HYC85_008577 [Camellia sinensis]|uniref:GPI inositol-deacylase n=1 Tax=Camellia sinensis TaxID=4442 RepID=A0A7J7HTY9_CAMSI|nr:hypothetical protein HYC85_008577 [Camellia sinensis]
MLRLCNRYRRCIPFSLRRHRTFSISSSSSSRRPDNSAQYPKDLKNPLPPPPSPPPPALLRHHSCTLSPLPSSLSLIALSTALISALAASYALFSTTETEPNQKLSRIYSDFEHAIDRSNNSLRRILNRMKQTGVAASVLWKSLRSVMSSANHEVRSGFEFRVAAFLADIASANASRRAAIVGAGGGAVVDWLLEAVAVFGDNCGTQAEAARALAYLIADPNVSEVVLGRPYAVPHLLRFIFASQPQPSKKQTLFESLCLLGEFVIFTVSMLWSMLCLLEYEDRQQSRRTSFDISDSLKGRSMLVAALMDIITSNCDRLDKVQLKPSLPGNAEMRDIAAAIEVIEEGGMHLDEHHGSEEGEDGGNGMEGIGIKILGGTTVVGLSRTNGVKELELSNASHFGSPNFSLKNLLFNKINNSSQENVTSAVVPGLWDDLICQHVAVPFAAWALANWAMASGVNRSHIQELDQDGHAVMTALTTAERSVKWHGSLVARLLLEDRNLPLNDSVPDWSFSLLSTVSQASKSEDIPLSQIALSAFLVSIERSPAAQKVVVEKGLHLMREIAKYATKHKPVQEALAKVLESLFTGDMHMSLEESQKWSGVLLSWVFGNLSSDTMRSSATTILSQIFEDYGPSSIPISQGWLALLLADILGSSKMKGNTQPKTDKVKTQIDQANLLYGQQVANQLADAVVKLAINQLGTATKSGDTFPLEDLLNLEPFSGPFKNLKKDSLPKFDAADSALATLKGIKALTELSAEDSEMQDRVSNASDEPSVVDTRDPSTVRVPPTAHIRRHAARLLTVLSVLPKVQKVIVTDKVWCKWLEDCASGRIPGCIDAKIQSYARATLLNAFCNYPNDSVGRKLTENPNSAADDSSSSHTDETQSCSKSEVPSLDVVFVHGLRGGPFKTWRLAEDKASTKSGLVEKIDEEAGKQGTFWPGEWLSVDLPHARMFSLKYKAFKIWSPYAFSVVVLVTNLTQWSGATLPLQEVSSMLLEKLVAAGIGSRPVVFVTHSMGGLVVKQMLSQAKVDNKDDLVDNTIGVVFYSCPHFGSKLADVPWRMGLVLRPAPTVSIGVSMVRIGPDWDKTRTNPFSTVPKILEPIQSV